MKKIISLLTIALLSGSLFAQKQAYKLFDVDGKRAKYEDMVAAAAAADIVLFGEQHDDPIAHWLEYELTIALFKERGTELILGAEMFEADNQLILDEFMDDLISEAKFEEEARLWPNYKTDYKPLVLFAKNHKLAFVATNIPRRYANSIYKKGIEILDSLSEEALEFIAPLPLDYDTTLNCYVQLKEGMEGMGGHATINMVDAQAIKDATMSHFILLNWESGKLLLHFNGAYHSDNFESINYFLNRERPGLKILTISTVKQEEINKLDKEYKGLANFIIAVPDSMTKTR